MLPRFARWLAFALTLGFLVPGGAGAVTTVQLDPQNSPQSIQVEGDPSSNHIEVAYDVASHRILISEPGITSVGSACTDTGDTVACTPPAPRSVPPVFQGGVVLSLREGDNTAHVSQSFPASYPVSFFGWHSGADSFIGGPEEDRIDGGPGADFISGGPGEDTVVYSQRVTPVYARLDGSPTSGNELDGPPGARDTLATDVEDIFGGNAADRLVGNASPNELIGFKSRDILIGLGGADRLAGEYGNPFAIGTSSANRLYGGRGRDFLLGEVGGDELFGGPGIDRIDAKDKQHEKTIDCGPGNDRKERATRDGGDPHPISC